MITFHTPSFGDDEFQLMDLPTMHQPQQTNDVPPTTHSPQTSAGYMHVNPNIMNLTHSVRNVGTNIIPPQTTDPIMAPKFPPQHFEVPDIMFAGNPFAGNPGLTTAVHPAYFTTLAPGIIPSNTYTISPSMPQQMTFAAPRTPTMTTINQSQISCQLGFKTVSPKQGSPTNSSHSTSSPVRESSEDSDDSVPLSQLSGGLKRPAEAEIVKVAVAKPVKKPKTPKRKKKKDPNEPQKPVSAYALFFRDTQAAIKGQNPSASFGEVSKIVASMWDGLDPDSKAEYKRRTEEAKKEYLKALAAYRASIVSQQTPQERADLLSSLQSQHAQHTTKPPPAYQPLPSPQTHPVPQTHHSHQVPHPHVITTDPGHMMSPHSMAQMQQPLSHDQLSYSQVQQSMMMNDRLHHQLSPMLPSNHDQRIDNPHINNVSPPQVMSPPHVMSPVHVMSPPHHVMSALQQNNFFNQNLVPAMCVRTGCMNPAIESPAWDNDYCSNDCVVTHCSNTFSQWVAGRQTSYTHVK